MINVVVPPQEGDEEDSDEAADKLMTAHPDADTTILFMTGEGWFRSFFSRFLFNKLLLRFNYYVFIFMMNLEFPANEIVRFLVGFTNKGSQDFTVQSLEASFRYPQDFQFYIQNVSLIRNFKDNTKHLLYILSLSVV